MSRTVELYPSLCDPTAMKWLTPAHKPGPYVSPGKSTNRAFPPCSLTTSQRKEDCGWSLLRQGMCATWKMPSVETKQNNTQVEDVVMSLIIYNRTKCFKASWWYFISELWAVLSFLPSCQAGIDIFYLLTYAETGVFKAWEWVTEPPSNRVVDF